MPTRPLPDSPSLEQLKKQAKALRRRVLAAEPAELAIVREFHPRAESSIARGFPLSDAQLVLARRYRFASWAKLREHLAVVRAYSHWPAEDTATTEAGRQGEHFLRLACLIYENDDPARLGEARRFLTAHPETATSDIHTMAATGQADAARAVLAADPELARAPGGPYGWRPLFYLAYSRISGDGTDASPLEMARLLLRHGADPDEGYLWRGLPSAFTVLTGVLGGGENNQPRHPDWVALAELLLTSGAEVNDSQGLYNRQFDGDNSHLELMLRHGLGRGSGGPWRARLAPAYPSPSEMLADQLLWAAKNNLVERVELLLAHGVDPDAHGMWNSDLGAFQAAALAGNQLIADRLAAAGAAPALNDVLDFVAACMVADRARVDALSAHDTTLASRALARDPHTIARAAKLGRLEVVELLAALGFDVNHRDRTTALHEAAQVGDVAMVRLLLRLGADPELADTEFGGTALDWAEHSERPEVVALLSNAS